MKLTRIGAEAGGLDEQAHAAVLLAEAVTHVTSRRYDVKDADLRALPQVQAILGASESVRRACILLAAAQDDWRAGRLLSIIARKRAGLSSKDIETILPPIVPRDPDGMDYPPDIRAGERLRPLIAQIEATWASLDAEGQRRLGPRLRELADWIFEKNVERRLRALIDPPPGASFDMISDDDYVGPALRDVLDASPEPLEARLALVGLLAEFPQSNGVGWNNPRNRPTRGWYTAARVIGDGIGDAAGLAAALLDAAIPVLEHQEPRCANEAILCGLTLFAGQVAGTAASGAGLLPRLRRLALSATHHSIRLANVSVEAIADAALPSSLTELKHLERDTRDGNLLKTVGRALQKLAAAQGIGQDELLERSVEAHGLSPDGHPDGHAGRRLDGGPSIRDPHRDR